MTTFDRFDPFERRISEAIDEIAAARPPDYLTDILRQTARTSQRPRWSFPERWINVDTTIARPTVFGRRVPFRSLVVLALLVAMIGAALTFYIGSQKKLPPPLGLAANGQIVFGMNGDLYIADAFADTPRLLVAGDGQQGGPVLSPDGRLVAYSSVVNDIDHVWVAGIDGSDPRQVFDRPFTGMTAQWSFDSRSMLLVTDALGNTSSTGIPSLWVAPADGSGASEVKLPGLYPLEATWDPTRPNVALVRAADASNGQVDLYYVDTAASAPILSKIDMRGAMLYGPEWEFSGLAFSPDGGTIAYNSVEAETTGEHFWAHLMNRDGTNDRTLALPLGIGPLYSQAWSVFSPDGEWIAMESWGEQTDGSEFNQIALARTDGSAPTRRVGPAIHGSSLLKSWSPDGTRILMCAVDTLQIYAIDIEAGTSERLPWTDCPNWQRVAP